MYPLRGGDHNYLVNLRGFHLTFPEARAYFSMSNEYDPPENGDACEVCLGRNGVPGNENIVDGVVMCDYCTADHLKEKSK